MIFYLQNSEAKVDEHLSKFVKFPEVAKTTNKDDDVKDSRIDGENGPESKESALCSKGNGKTVPRYKILHRGHFDIQDYTVGRYKPKVFVFLDSIFFVFSPLASRIYCRILIV